MAPTTGPATAGAIAREHIAAGADLILAAGGDGTINEVAEGMVHSRVPLGILPAGTANVLAMEMRWARKLQRAAERLERMPPAAHLGGAPERGRRQAVAPLSADGGSGTGCARGVSRERGAEGQDRQVRLLGSGLEPAGTRLPQIEVEAGGQTHTCSFALLSKVRNYGGDFEIARDVTLFDDEFEVVLFEGRSSLPYVKYFAGMAINRLAGMKGVTVLRTDCARLTAPNGSRAYVQVDGEYAGHLPAEIRIVPDALTLLVPRSMGFTKTVDVPDGNRLSFVILVREGAEVMMQSIASVQRDEPKFAPKGDSNNVGLFVEVEDFGDVLKRLDGYPITMPERTTFYGMREISMHEPGGHIVVFAVRT